MMKRYVITAEMKTEGGWVRKVFENGGAGYSAYKLFEIIEKMTKHESVFRKIRYTEMEGGLL